MATDDGSPTRFTNVDQTSDPRYFIEFLDARKAIQGEREVKQLIVEMLAPRPGFSVLDVGCGTGDDAREIAAIVSPGGRVVGIDLSEALVAESEKRAAGSGLAVEFRTGDVRKLDFPDESFDCVRTDRVLMFVPEIEKAVSEIARVLRPGGRVVASELDHEMHFQGSHFPDITRKVFSAFGARMPQHCLGRQLHRIFAEQGLRNVKSEPRVIRPPYQTFRRVFDGFLASAIAHGELTEAEVASWIYDITALDRAGLFNNGVVVFTASGEKR